ncbi:hypothetical protein ACJX0J_026139 [Zea mays]
MARDRIGSVAARNSSFFLCYIPVPERISFWGILFGAIDLLMRLVISILQFMANKRLFFYLGSVLFAGKKIKLYIWDNRNPADYRPDIIHQVITFFVNGYYCVSKIMIYANRCIFHGNLVLLYTSYMYFPLLIVAL